MGRVFRGTMPLVAVISWFGISAARADGTDDAVAKKLTELGRITGTEATQGALQTLLADKNGAKKLIAAALPVAKEKTGALSYNAALVLALVSAELKDMKSSELFFRVCMDQAAKLQSAHKLLQSYVGAIELCYESKNFDDVIRICREVLELKADDGKLRSVLVAGITRFGSVDFEEDKSFDPARRVRVAAQRYLMQALAKQGKYDQAIKLVDSLVKASKNDWKELQLKGMILREAGKYAEAVKVYEDVIERVSKDADLEPDEKEFDLERFHYTLSNIFVDMGKINLATEKLQLLLAKKPDDPGYNNDLGYIWADNGIKLDEAERMIRKALELDRKRRQADAKFDPATDHDNGAYLDSLGWVLFKKGNFTEAKKFLQEAVDDKASQHIEIFDHLGDVHLALGEKAEALAAWRKGLELAGDGRRELERKVIVEKKIDANK